MFISKEYENRTLKLNSSRVVTEVAQSAQSSISASQILFEYKP